jgi:hypothetical protein
MPDNPILAQNGSPSKSVLFTASIADRVARRIFLQNMVINEDGATAIFEAVAFLGLTN